MNSDEINALWNRAVKERAHMAEMLFATGGKPTQTDMIAVALAHPETYDILIKLKR